MLTAGGGYFDISVLFFFLSPFLWEMARKRLNYCLKWPLDANQINNEPSTCERLDQLPK